MGWFNSIFKKDSGEQIPENEIVDLFSMDDWVDDRAARQFENIRKDVEKQFFRLIDLTRELRQNLDILSQAELRNTNITERENQIMKGNRQAYISQHKQFINMIVVPNSPSCQETSDFCKGFEELMVRLARSTVKGHAVMNEFFSAIVSEINKRLKLMGETVTSIKEILDDNSISDIGTINRSVSELRAKRKLLNELDNDIDVMRKKLSNSNNMKKKLLKSMDEIKKGKDYSKFRTADEQKSNLKKQIGDVEDAVSMMFSPINKAMRKYERVLAEGADIFNNYIDNPTAALAADDSLMILQLLKKMRIALSERSVEVKDPDKIVGRIEGITIERLRAKKAKYIDARKGIKEIDEQLRSNQVLQDINGLNYKVEHVDNQISLLNDKIERSVKTRDKIDLKTLQSDVKKRILDAFNVEVDITWEDKPKVSQSSS
ncbi:hypothetical protein HQ545_04625 [Candidatus Woesearchaeota archaeon]|nr:hypothetical protein [Candidatus Woesearchaeota archaeon]